MPQTAWPVEVDMQLLRTRANKILDQLNEEFDWLDSVLNGPSSMNYVPIEAEQEKRFKDRLAEIVAGDPVLNEFSYPTEGTHKTILTHIILDEVFGFGPLGPVLRDVTVFDILVEGPDAVFAQREGRYEKSSVFFENEAHLRRTIDKITVPLGHRLSRDNPVISAMLPNGSWVIAALPLDDSKHQATLIVKCARA